MNLKCIISEYKKELSVHASNLKQKLFLEYEVNSTNVIDKYVNYRNEVGSKKAEDAFNNTKLFLDGNKRIGAHAMLVFLFLNGYELKYTQKELSDIILDVAAGKKEYEDILFWYIV